MDIQYALVFIFQRITKSRKHYLVIPPPGTDGCEDLRLLLLSLPAVALVRLQLDGDDQVVLVDQRQRGQVEAQESHLQIRRRIRWRSWK